jgi:hypothetical protein
MCLATFFASTLEFAVASRSPPLQSGGPAYVLSFQHQALSLLLVGSVRPRPRPRGWRKIRRFV